MIKIDFEKTSVDGLLIFRDALHLPDDHTYSDIELEAMKQSRFDNWYTAITTMPDLPVDPTEEQV